MLNCNIIGYQSSPMLRSLIHRSDVHICFLISYFSTCCYIYLPINVLEPQIPPVVMGLSTQTLIRSWDWYHSELGCSTYSHTYSRVWGYTEKLGHQQFDSFEGKHIEIRTNNIKKPQDIVPFIPRRNVHNLQPCHTLKLNCQQVQRRIADKCVLYINYSLGMQVWVTFPARAGQ